VVIDFGTTGDAETLALAERIRRKGDQWLSAPASGGQVGERFVEELGHGELDPSGIFRIDEEA